MEQTYTLGTRLADRNGNIHIVVDHHEDGTALLLEECIVEDGAPCDEGLATEDWAESNWGPLAETPDADRSAAALAHYRAEKQATQAARDVMSGEEQVTAFAAQPFKAAVTEAHEEYREADAALKAAQEAVEAAAKRRAERIREMVNLTGSQTAAAKVLGINQSNISRALALLAR